MIGIIDYGRGNLRSVENALNHLHIPCIISDQPEILHACEKLILPGVGAFKDCMENLYQTHLYEWIKTEVEAGKPILGICLGMQMLYEESQENGLTKGFGFLKGSVEYIDDETVSIPEIGWNALQFTQDHPLKTILSDHPYMYYVHSYYAKGVKEDELYAYSQYGTVKVSGLVGKDNVLGTQFHPEKSGEDGLKLLKWFAEEFK